MANKLTPRIIFDGFDDQSVPLASLDALQTPQHLPLFVFTAKKGELTTQFHTAASARNAYDAETLTEGSKWFSHQIVGLLTAAQQGNICACRRVADADAKNGVMAVGVEVLQDMIPVWETDPSTGRFLLDSNGDKQQATDGNGDPATVLGYRRRLVVFPDADATNWNTLAKRAGTLTGVDDSGDPTTSEIYPLMAGLGQVGEFTTNMGFTLQVANSYNAKAGDATAMEENETLLYRLQWMQRARKTATPRYILTLSSGSNAVDFPLEKGGITNSKTSATYNVQDITKKYSTTDPDTVKISAPVSQFRVYHDSINEVLELLFASEGAATDTYVTTKEQINLFNDEGDAEGRAYKTLGTFVIGSNGVTATDNVITADGSTVNYLQGGADGDVSEDALDTLAEEFFTQDWDDPVEPLKSPALYPFSRVTDTGFALATKMVILDLMSVRQDIGVDVCTFIHDIEDLSVDAEISMGQTLKSRGMLSPESTLYGTPACRFNIWGSQGEWVESNYDRPVSTVIDIIYKRARYLGAAQGIPQSRLDYTARENNAIVRVKNVTHSYKSFSISDTYWGLGVNYVMARDMSTLFWPAYQTGYEEDRSVLNSELSVAFCIDVYRRCIYHWSINTGADGMTDAQFIQRSNDDFADVVRGRYDGKLTVTGVTTSPEVGEWQMEVAIAGNTQRTVGTYHLAVTQRASA